MGFRGSSVTNIADGRAIFRAWAAALRDRLDDVRKQIRDVQPILVSARSRGVETDKIRGAEKLITQARSHVDLITRDRSLGAHNTEFTEMLLDGAESRLEEAMTLVGSPD